MDRTKLLIWMAGRASGPVAFASNVATVLTETARLLSRGSLSEEDRLFLVRAWMRGKGVCRECGGDTTLPFYRGLLCYRCSCPDVHYLAQRRIWERYRLVMFPLRWGRCIVTRMRYPTSCRYCGGPPILRQTPGIGKPVYQPICVHCRPFKKPTV